MNKLWFGDFWIILWEINGRWRASANQEFQPAHPVAGHCAPFRRRYRRCGCRNKLLLYQILAYNWL
jgi:hypothetical protein